MNLKLIVRKNVTLSRCPNCLDLASLRRSRSRNILEKILRTFKLKHYSCQNCGWRGIKFGYKLSKNYISILFIYVIITLIVFYFVEKFLINYFE